MAKIKIPLEVVEIDRDSYHIFIPSIINDAECDILIDTGASRTVFDKESMSALPIDIDYDEIISSGLGPGKIDTEAGVLKNITIGKHTWKKVNAIFMDFSHINEIYEKMSNKKIAGLIGGDFLYSAKARIDYEKKEVTFNIDARKKNIFG